MNQAQACELLRQIEQILRALARIEKLLSEELSLDRFDRIEFRDPE